MIIKFSEAEKIKIISRITCKTSINKITGCWDYNGSIKTNGYGSVRIKK